MATKRKTSRRRPTKRKPTKRRTTKKQPFPYTSNVIGLVLLALAALGLFNLGLLGTLWANLIRLFIGDTYQFGLVLIGALGAALAITGVLPQLKGHYWIGGGLVYGGWLLWITANHFIEVDQHSQFFATTWQAGLADLWSGGLTSQLGGGAIGAFELSIVAWLIALVGAQVASWLIMVGGVIVFFQIPFADIQRWFQTIWQTLHHGVQASSDALKRGNEKVQQRREKRTAAKPAKPAITTPTDPDAKDLPTPHAAAKSAAPEPSYHITVANEQPKAPASAAPADAGDADDTEASLVNSTPVDPNYQLPTADLLKQVPPTDQTDEVNAIDANTKILKQTLDSFGVDAEVKNVSLGPSVTEYELHPAIGVKVSRIVNLADDLALALAAKGIRIQAPIPGKSLIGIEVPNKEVSTVAFRDVVEAQPPHPNKPLQVPLGRNVTGQVVSMDLTKMPHLLIAGATGSGKSVAINDIITSILMNARPDQVKLMLIDPKKVELSVYNGIPHLLTPVVSEPKKAARALHKVVAEMERRYELFSQFGQRKISTYNAFVQKANAEDDQARPTLPYIVVVVDELADLMMTVSNEVEDAIIRLAQMGRAAGVHMILATQRPSVDVITGLIKANVPSRIAFAVSSGIDSRTILDTNGAEKLLGRGDMLYQPVDANSPVRVQGAFIPDEDVTNVVDFIKQQQTADYDEDMMVTDEEIQQEEAGDSDDELFDDALKFVVDQQKASTSLLQRRFRIGYNRAARIMDDLEQRGYIGPQEGSKPRQVYKQPDSSADQPDSSE
ncbi:FtsK/SpoIIIE family DNA translocase [Levilactobacillus parabrevis]|uniref:DNA translocase FtsK n=2 Tax=Levilactobacillus parabrevis TaxID=357278 RepID=A0A0R1H0F9_9LACO|nr:DNA translocase FtsK [Levilactobacillus parabrevis]KRK37891.1 DNA segregation ATPase FtsK SpoIIIE related protein [Levilactobacillus parabrevis ATCC 53295]KRO06450.1 DNA segregation ATPase FtsK SpoIIIE related protein [Levilactobacillus parabrevis]